jgi:flagella basal body P-ring formation protein FlgA
MILSLFIFLFSFAAGSVDTAVASAVETMISSRVRAVHEIEYRSVPRELEQLDRQTSVRIMDEPRASYRGVMSVPVEVTPRAGGSRRFILGIRVRTFESVAVAAAMIDKHQELAPAHVVMQNIETTQMNGTPVTDAAGVARMRTKQIIAAGKVITASMIEPLPMIASGSPVTVVVRKDNVTLSIAGTARTDGWEGGVIPVDVQTLNRHLNAKVVDAHNVEVIEK